MKGKKITLKTILYVFILMFMSYIIIWMFFDGAWSFIPFKDRNVPNGYVTEWSYDTLRTDTGNIVIKSRITMGDSSKTTIEDIK